jgi:hypothetical protein
MQPCQGWLTTLKNKLFHKVFHFKMPRFFKKKIAILAERSAEKIKRECLIG